MMEIVVPLDQAQFSSEERLLLRTPELEATGFRYRTGIPAVRLANARGHVIVLPWMGQIVWDATFDGIRLTMQSLFDAPRPASCIVDTYGCYAFHSGLLRNGCPGPEDTHTLHGEFACAVMDSAQLVLTQIETGWALRVESELVHAQGFGSRYRATARVTLPATATLFDIGLAVENTGGRTMDLMYMCHINPAFAEGASIVQPAPYLPETVRVRHVVPAHEPSTTSLLKTIARLAEDPAPSATLDGSVPYDPEQVFYLHGIGASDDGATRLMLRRPDGDGFAMAFNLNDFPHVVRWLMKTEDHAVAAFALPSTCEPEGFLAEQRKGNVVRLSPGQMRRFSVTTGYVDRAAAGTWASEIATLSLRSTLPTECAKP